MRRLAAAGFALVAGFAAPAAWGDDGNVCKESYEQAQVLMRPSDGTTSLLPAREKLRTCMRSSCKDWMVDDCSKWLADVERRIPTIVFAAKNTAGRDLTDVQVTTANGVELAARLDGHATEVEPGEQVFVFIGAGGARREKTVIVREGERSETVAATFDASPEELAASMPPPPPPTPARPRASSTMRYVGYTLAGTGAVGIGIGAIFGLNAIARKDHANCDGTGACDPGPLASATHAATASNVAFAAGGAVLAGGLALIILAPSSHVEVRASAGAIHFSTIW